MKEKRLPRARTRQPRNGSGGLVSRGGYSGCLTAQLPEPREHGFRNHVRRHFREYASVGHRNERCPIPNGGRQHEAVAPFPPDQEATKTGSLPGSGSGTFGRPEDDGSSTGTGQL